MKYLILLVVIGLLIGIGAYVIINTGDDYDITKKYDQYQYCNSFCKSLDSCDIINSEITDEELVCKYYQDGVYKTHSINLDKFD